MQTVKPEEFRARVDSSVRIRECPHCGHVAEIRVVIPIYGKVGARVQCPHCNCQTPYTGIAEQLLEEGTSRYATPDTPEAILAGILEAVKIWNGPGGYGNGT